MWFESTSGHLKNGGLSDDCRKVMEEEAYAETESFYIVLLERW